MRCYVLTIDVLEDTDFLNPASTPAVPSSKVSSQLFIEDDIIFNVKE